MKKLKFKDKFFLSISLLITIVIFSGSYFYYFNSTNTLKESEKQNSQMLLNNITSQIDNLYNNLDTGLNYLINSPSLKSLVIDLNEHNNLNYLQENTRKSLVESHLSNIIFIPNISNVLLYNKNKNYFFYSGFTFKDKDYLNLQLKNNDLLPTSESKTTFLPPHINPWKNDSSKIISVKKSFSISPETILEIQAPYSVLKNICEQKTFAENKEILILDNNYDLIYPFNKTLSVVDNKYFLEIKENLINEVDTLDTNNYSYYKAKSSYTGFNILLLSNNLHLKKQNFKLLTSAFLICLFVLFLILFTLDQITKRLSKPLNELIENINNVNIDENFKISIQNEDFDEFILINNSFNNMIEKVNHSLSLVYESEIKELNASFSALQSQINPHFLYNTLNAISAASEIYGSEVTTKMCQELSFMLRYTTSNEEKVLLIDEIIHLKNYLSLMEISNAGQLSVSLDISVESYNLKLPKLTIQPLVENCFKHGFKNKLPPWNISVSSFVSDNSTFIIIEDNGTGFDKDFLKEFSLFEDKTKIENSFSKIYKELNIGGLGLKNIFARLSILYKDSLSFELSNHSDGAKIIIKVVHSND